MRRSEAAEEATLSVPDTRMIKVGAALTGGGLMLATLGMTLAAISALRGAMLWSRQRGISPATAAAVKMEQAKHASIAGMHAWREHAGATTDGHRAH